MSPVNDDRVVVPDHAVEMWVKRGGRVQYDRRARATVVEVWRRGHEVAEHRFEADEVRHDPESGMVLLFRDGVVKTAIAERTASHRADLGAVE